MLHFGVYEQYNDNANGLEPIKWQVMDISDGKALLVSCYILDNIEYNESEGVYGTGDSESNPWSQSYVYSWLNKDFAQTAFSEEELKIITDTTDYSVTDEYGALEGRTDWFGYSCLHMMKSLSISERKQLL